MSHSGHSIDNPLDSGSSSPTENMNTASPSQKSPNISRSMARSDLPQCPNCQDSLVGNNAHTQTNSTVVTDHATGTSYCTSCGSVVQENQITADLSFQEAGAGQGGSGGARMIGRFLGADRTSVSTATSYSALHSNRNFGSSTRSEASVVGSENSGSSSTSSNFGPGRLASTTGRPVRTPSIAREQTISAAKRRLHELAQALGGLSDYHVDRATQCYKLALMNNFTKGRRLHNVLAACLYVICRQEKTMHMLLDFSDVLSVNLYSLGSTFLHLTRTLHIRLPLTDPSIYLPRFTLSLFSAEELGKLPANLPHKITTTALHLLRMFSKEWLSTGRRPGGICGACLVLAFRSWGIKRDISEVCRVVRVAGCTVGRRLVEFGNCESSDVSIKNVRQIDPVELDKEEEFLVDGIQTGDNKSKSFPPSFYKMVLKQKVEQKQAQKRERMVEMVKKVLGDLEHEGGLSPRVQYPNSPRSPQITSAENVFSQDQEDLESEINDLLAIASKNSQKDSDERSDTSSPSTTNTETISLSYSSDAEDPDEILPSNYPEHLDPDLQSCLLSSAESEIKSKIWQENNKDWEEEIERKRAREARNTTVKRKRTKRSTRDSTPLDTAKRAIESKASAAISKKINYAALEELLATGESG